MAAHTFGSADIKYGASAYGFNGANVQDLEDSITISDTITNAKTSYRILTESIVISDTIRNSLEWVLVLSEEVTTTDITTKNNGIHNLSETITISEDVDILGLNKYITITESLTLTDTQYKHIQWKRNFNETINSLDNILIFGARNITLLENISIEENKTFSYVKAINDSITLSSTPYAENNRILFDGITINDNVQNWLYNSPKVFTWSTVSTNSSTWVPVTTATNIWN